MNRPLLVAILALACGTAQAGFQTVPEPDSFALLAVAGVAALVIVIRNRRK